MALNAYSSCEWKIHFFRQSVLWPSHLLNGGDAKPMSWFFFNSVTFGVLYKDSTQKHLSEGNFKNLVTEEELLNLNMLKAMN